MKKFAKTAAVTATLLTALGTAPAANAQGGQFGVQESLRAFGLTDDGNLVRFRTNSPQTTRVVGAFSGFQTDTALVGIDFRVQDGLLYGVGNQGGLYSIDTTNAALTLVDRLTVALDGTQFGVDFNPAANALRIISNTGQNLRHPFATLPAATAIDTALTFPPTVGTTLNVTAAAYTNNDLDTTTATTLFVINTDTNQLAIQAPANNGTLSAVGTLAFDPDAATGFDIASRIKQEGRTVENRGFVTLLENGKYRLYQVNLLTAASRRTAAFDTNVVDIAISLDN
jgi:Domain of unknown function (DUF4394)